MELNAEGRAKTGDAEDSALSAQLTRILDDARKQLEEEFRKRLESALHDAENASTKLAENEREQALSQARLELSAELRGEFDQTLQQNTARLQTEFEQRLSASTKQWETEKARLQEQLDVWRTYADAQREMGESSTQAEILSHFLDRAEPFAPNLAVYVGKADGLALWRTRGAMAFPKLVSKETIDPDAYFRTIVVREKIVAAVCARHPLKPESLDFLSGALGRAIESFGMRLQNRVPGAAS